MGYNIRTGILCFICLMCLACQAQPPVSTLQAYVPQGWENIETQGLPTARHEAALVAIDKKIYLLGGRRINPVDVFDTQTQIWTEKAPTPVEIHHFQAVTIGESIYILGAMTGPSWPNETPLENVLIYHTKTDSFEVGDPIPHARRRGGAGAVYHDGKIYLIGGITNGHIDGYVNWFDSYDIETGEWEILPDAPHERDHFQAAITGNKLFAFAGRRSEQRLNLGFEQTVASGDVFDFKTGRWEPSSDLTQIPTPRAGNMMITIDNKIIVGGGESGSQTPAHNEVELFDPKTQLWSKWPNLLEGRHGTGFVLVDDYLYTASGSGNRGGGPELTTIERLRIRPNLSAQTKNVVGTEAKKLKAQTSVADKESMQWHTLTLDFEGPQSSETAAENPFTDYRLLVEFTQGDERFLIRGFYAADGDAGNTSANSGNIWRVRFTPNKTGDWQYRASLKRGKNIAISRDTLMGETVKIAQPTGVFNVAPSTAIGVDFRAPERGRLRQAGRYFQFENSKRYWLKGGPNSPENLLGYVDFDDTYRLRKESRDGEASTEGEIHTFEPHRKDLRSGDPLWGLKSGEPRGHALIGAINYIAEQGMNTVYFLTNNITGDGNDVWPYRKPDEFDRFDVSKLEQWEVLFSHMQAKGVLLHMVTQETENELMLDEGDVGFYRALYYHELIARFGHHPALIWNLGEENGPSSWMKTGQTDRQRKDMTSFFAANDPYNHIVLLHSHAAISDINHTFSPLLGHSPLDGISMQLENVEDSYAVTRDWHARSRDAGNPWMVTLDEIGKWYNGALPDDVDPDHNHIRRHALWGNLLAGGAGVEWYFGSKFHSNDVSLEDWRTRHKLWGQTRTALAFFKDYLPYWEMGDCEGIVTRNDTYCLGKTGEIYAFYMPGRGSAMLNLPDTTSGGYSVDWFDPKIGGSLKKGSIETLGTGANQFIGQAPNSKTEDWVVLIRKL